MRAYKRDSLAIINFGIFWILVAVLHNYLQKSDALEILPHYWFHGTFSLLLCLLILRFSAVKKMDQLGFIYLGSVLLKILIYAILFHSILFGEISLSSRQSANMLIPLFLGIIFEVVFIAKILRNTTTEKNG